MTKICIASGTRGQSINVLEKIITELKPNSPELCNEIDERQSKINGTNAQIIFKNGLITARHCREALFLDISNCWNTLRAA